jgi:hypothetical protein
MSSDTLIASLELLKEYIGPYGIETPVQAIDRCIAIVRDQSGEILGDSGLMMLVNRDEYLRLQKIEWCVKENSIDITAKLKRESGELAHIFQIADGQNRYRPRILDLCYTAFMTAKGKNSEDGGATDWFTDTLPKLVDEIKKMKTRIEAK